MAHGFEVNTRTVHTIHITVPDDVLGKLDLDGEVQVVLLSRAGSTLPKKLSYRDMRGLMEGDTRLR